MHEKNVSAQAGLPASSFYYKENNHIFSTAAWFSHDKEKSRNKEDVAASAEGEDSNDIYQQEQLQEAEVLHELLPGVRRETVGRIHREGGLMLCS